MAKRQAKKEEIKQRKAKGEVISPEEEAQNPFRSSKGFASSKGFTQLINKTDSQIALNQIKNEVEFMCPFKNCGRKFTSED